MKERKGKNERRREIDGESGRRKGLGKKERKKRKKRKKSKKKKEKIKKMNATSYPRHQVYLQSGLYRLKSHFEFFVRVYGFNGVIFELMPLIGIFVIVGRFI
ncbi:unnamed protein product [Cuscuta europaea]|uniref:Uncharacterized protein n=1 Tax=Cuscuta europaea TaxID=41803 RepID=A0A9P0ZI04_CUSEU|nr:unnamed protein product [Cuscuta europaea]